MPSMKRKYNVRFPAGRIKKIMQTDEEVGKVAQAVPIIISRTLELFVESLLNKALQVTAARNAKTLSPSHVKQCILAESRFDFLKDLVKNIPDVSAAEEKELMSAESSPNSSRFSDMSVQRRIVREDSNSSSSSDVRIQQAPSSREHLKRGLSSETDVPIKIHRNEGVTSTIMAVDAAMDLTKKPIEERPVRTANFYQETLTDDVQCTQPHRSVITVNPSYSSPQPSTSFTKLRTFEPLQRVDLPLVRQNSLPTLPRTPVTPVINIDFTKNITNPEIKVLDKLSSIVGVPKTEKNPKLQRQNSKKEIKKVEVKPPPLCQPVDIDSLNSGNLQIDEDYDT